MMGLLFLRKCSNSKIAVSVNIEKSVLNDDEYIFTPILFHGEKLSNLSSATFSLSDD